MGKFDSEETEFYYNITLDGGADEEIGSVDGFGWYGRVGNFILSEDSQGFVDGTKYDTDEEAKQVFATIVTEALRWEEQTGIYV